MKAKDRSAIDYLNDIRDASEKAAVLLRVYSCNSWTNDLNFFFQATELQTKQMLFNRDTRDKA
jgi:hypothetical protein